MKHVTLRRHLKNSLGLVWWPQYHILFSRLWTAPSGLVPRLSGLIASSLSIIINFFCSPCQGLLFFYSSYLLQNTIEDSIKICKSYFYSFWFVSSGCVLKLEHERLLNDMVVHLQQDHGGHWPLKPEPAWQEATVAATSWTSFVPTEPLALDGHFQELGLNLLLLVPSFICSLSVLAFSNWVYFFLFLFFIYFFAYWLKLLLFFNLVVPSGFTAYIFNLSQSIFKCYFTSLHIKHKNTCNNMLPYLPPSLCVIYLKLLHVF